MVIYTALDIIDSRYTPRVRVCMCVGLFSGVYCADVSAVLMVNACKVSNELTALSRLHYVTRARKGRRFVYHLTNKGREWIAGERAKVAGDALGLLARARLVRYARLSLIDEMETTLRLE